MKCKLILPGSCIVSQQCVGSQGPQEQDEMAGPLLSIPKDKLGLPAQVECARREAITQTAHPSIIFTCNVLMFEAKGMFGT